MFATSRVCLAWHRSISAESTSLPQQHALVPRCDTAVCHLQAAEELPQSRKIELVAKALRAALVASPGGQGRFLRPILASFAVVGELEGALGIVKQVKERQLAAEGESSFPMLVSSCFLTSNHDEHV